MKKFTLLLIALLMVNLANAGRLSHNFTGKSASISTENPIPVRDVQTTYTITTSVNPANAGYVYGGGTYNAGQGCALSVHANSGYIFVNWTENGNIVSTDSIYFFTVTVNRNIVANFNVVAPLTYTITATSNPTLGGTTTGSGTYNSGQYCMINATANSGFSFANWTENGVIVSFDSTYYFYVNSNRNLQANFSTTVYTIHTTTNPTSGCNAIGGGTFIPNQSCKLRAFPASSFINWTENSNIVSTDSIYIFNVTSSRNLVANFNITPPTQYTIAVSAIPSFGGSITGSGTFTVNQNCTLHATANTGFGFTKWMENGNLVSSNATYTFSVNANRSLLAIFDTLPISQYLISTSSNPANGGSTTGGGNYILNQSCTVHATPNTGYYFVNWTLNGGIVSTTANYIFTVTANKNLVANFSLISPTQYTITTTANPSAAGLAYGGGNFNANQFCTVHVYAFTGFVFTNWTENGNIVSYDSTYTFAVTANRNLVANFSALQYNISTTANPLFGGTTSGGGTYSYYQSCALTATPNSGFTFVNWTANGMIQSYNPNYSFLVTSNMNFTANFTNNPCTINAYASPAYAGSVYGGGTFAPGQICTVSAFPNSGYSFLNWTENGVIVSTVATYQFSVTIGRNLQANFSSTQHSLTVSPNPTIGGNAYGGGTFNHHQLCSVNATPNNGYTFVNWTQYGNIVSFDSIYSFYLDSNLSLVANFTTNPLTITTSANPANGGSCQGGGMFVNNQTCNLIATANPGYSFVNWTENGNTVSNYYFLPFTVLSNRNITANFIPIPLCSAQFTLMPDSSILHHYFIINNATGAAPLHYLWSWGDGTYDSIAYPSHTYAVSGMYNICLTIIDALGCSANYCYNANLLKSTNDIISIDVIQGSVGIKPEKTSIQLRIYPNPAKDNLTIESNKNSKQSLNIVNLIGQTVYSANIYGKTTIDVSTFPKGIYFLSLNANNETIVKKFVKE